jgi:hypothetical protein
MRPHEEEWMTFPGVANQHGQTAVTDNAHRMVCLTRAYDGDELARFIAAAPAMARALLRVLGVCANTGSRARGCIEDNIKYPCQACEAKAALKAAGVLP